MTLNQIVSACAHINELSKSVFPYQTARSLCRLKKRLKDELDVVLDIEKTMVSAYGGTVNRDGSYKFPSAEQQKQFIAEYEKTLTQEQDIKLPVVDLSKFTNSIRISPAAMEALDGIVIFEKEEEEEI